MSVYNSQVAVLCCTNSIMQKKTYCENAQAKPTIKTGQKNVHTNTRYIGTTVGTEKLYILITQAILRRLILLKCTISF